MDLAYEYSWQQKELERHEKTKDEYLEQKAAITVRLQTESRLIAWQVVDRYALYNSRENMINEWDVYGERVDWEQFPKNQ